MGWKNMIMFWKSKEEKKLDEIIEKINGACDRMVKASEYLVQVTQYLNNSVQALHQNFTEIRKEIENTKNEALKQLKEINTSLDGAGNKIEDFSKKLDKIEPVGLGSVESILSEIVAELEEVNSNLKWSSGTYTDTLESMLRDIKDEISSLRYDMKYST